MVSSIFASNNFKKITGISLLPYIRLLKQRAQCLSSLDEFRASCPYRPSELLRLFGVPRFSVCQSYLYVISRCCFSQNCEDGLNGYYFYSAPHRQHRSHNPATDVDGEGWNICPEPEIEGSFLFNIRLHNLPHILF